MSDRVLVIREGRPIREFVEAAEAGSGADHGRGGGRGVITATAVPVSHDAASATELLAPAGAR